MFRHPHIYFWEAFMMSLTGIVMGQPPAEAFRVNFRIRHEINCLFAAGAGVEQVIGILEMLAEQESAL
jgi:hypothetical protein